MATQPMPPPPRSAPRPPTTSPSAIPSTPAKPKFSLADILTGGKSLKPRIAIMAPPGWGKTSMAAQAPKPIVLQSQGETGVETLIEYGQLPPTSYTPAAENWDEANAHLDFLLAEDHGFETAVVDTINGIERLCFEHVCQKEFGGDWGERGFAAYGKGVEVSLAAWRGYIAKLDRLRRDRDMTVILLSHMALKTLKNPTGADYDRHQPKMHDKTWAFTEEWCDAVLFGSYQTVVVGARGKEETDPTKKGKAMGGHQRILLTQGAAGYVAKNRLGLPPEIDCGDSPVAAWKAFTDAAMAAKKGNN